MNTFLCLAITFLLAGLIFIYVRNQITALESKMFHLTEAVRSLAEPLKADTEPLSEPATEPQLKRCYVSDDSESDSDEESEHATVVDLEEFNASDTKFVELKEVPEMEVRMIPLTMTNVMQIMNAPLAPFEFERVNEATIDVHVEDPVIEVEGTPDFEKMTMKELKDLAVAKGAPSSIRSRKALIDFLNA